MDITKSKVKSILKTLPIGYYCGRQLQVSLGDSDCSYYNFVEDKIVVSFQQLSAAFEKLQSEDDIENDIRCMLYHEVSHSILTPKTLTINYETNVFEDERIETLLHDYYMNVNFKDFCKRLNNYNGLNPKTIDEAFFNIVRFRVGPQEFVDRVQNIIDAYANLTRFSNDYDSYCYYLDIDQLYNDIKKWFEQMQQNKHQSKGNSDHNDQTDDRSKNDSGDQTNQENDQSKNADIDLNLNDRSKNEINENLKQMDDNLKSIHQKAYDQKQLFESVVNKYENKALEQEFTTIFNEALKKANTNGSAINSYSGRFDYRSAGRNDCKFFVQQNRNGHVKQFSKVRLNLFIDKSGSFKCNETKVNTMLKVLSKLEKQTDNFEYTLTTCGIGQQLMKKEERELHCGGGTCLTAEIFEQYKSLQVVNVQNINVVLYDGDAFYNDQDGNCCKHLFKAFNHQNCIVITDPENQMHVSDCPDAKVIVTSNYTEELIKNVEKLLTIAIR